MNRVGEVPLNRGTPKNGKDEAARRLAAIHFEIEPGMRRIFRIFEAPNVEALDTTPIKLLEVNDASAPGGILPLQFGPAPERGIDYPVVIVEVTPDEFDRIKNRKLKLPRSWRIGAEIARPTG